MTLAQYLEKNQLTYSGFAESIGVDRETVRRWALGLRDPDLTALRTLHRATKGKVTPNDFLQKAAA